MELDFLKEADENIIEVDTALVQSKSGKKEHGVVMTIGDNEKQFEIVITKSELRKIIKVLNEETVWQ